MQKLEQAAKEYVGRRERMVHPDGYFDNAGRWYPYSDEVQNCCKGIRSPSRAYPYSYMTHCRTAIHVANLYEVDATDLRRAVKEMDGSQVKAKREGGDNYFKAVAFENGKLLSIFDGETEYRIGLEMKETARQNHAGGFYVYKSIKEAENAVVPYDSALIDAPRVIIRCKVEGSYCRYSNGKFSFSRITPLKIVQKPVDVEVSELVCSTTFIQRSS